MLKPEIGQLINETPSVYGLCVAIAKRARDISDQAAEDGIELPDKPINIAIDEFGHHQLRLVVDLSVEEGDI
ncbi:MAG: DNA-directed RNA polymerase subunit omega [Oscillospiraceae bacterium]|jgi:DNA-directed RNA polymerase subunit omega